MICEKQQTKKYKLRNSPPYSAMDCKGKTMKGKDGTYVSKPDKNNRYKWVKYRRIKTIEKIVGKPLSSKTLFKRFALYR